MNKVAFLLFSIGMVFLFAQTAKAQYESDIIKTMAGDVTITFIGHGSLMFAFNNLIIHVDPFSRVADYGQLPKADLVLITHEHSDHLDLKALEQIRGKDTAMVISASCAGQVKGATTMKNSDVQTVRGIKIEAVAAYNLVHKRPDGQPFHPKGLGNGYILTFGDKRIYIAGDTENIPEMAALGDIECAFLPMNLPYTMSPEMAAAAAKTVQPKIVYPYHFGDTDTAALVELLKGNKEMEVRIRRLQ